MRRSGLRDMGFLFWPFILSFALALPNQGLPSKSRCVRMTPEKEKQIDLIVEKLGHFLHNLTIEHEHFDIRLIQLSIEQHTENEVEEKETMLKLSVNDCELTDDEVEEIDHHREKAKEHEKERLAKKEREAKEKLEKEQKKRDEELTVKEEGRKEEELTRGDYDVESKPNFQVMYLDLDEDGQKLVEALDKNKPGPRLVYVQKDKGQLDYLFLRR